MKTRILSLLTLLAATLGLISCSEKWEPTPDPMEKTGQVSLLSMGVDVSTAENVITRATVDLSNFMVSVSNSEGMVVNKWKYSEMPEIITLPVGNYKVDVVSHEVKKAAWEEPLYIGSKEFTIEENKINDIGIVNCLFSNIKVTIKFTKNLADAAGDDVVVKVVANDEGSLEYTINETRAGFFEAVEGSTTLVATLTGTIKGQSYEHRIVLDDVAAGQHRIITYDFKNPNPPIPGESGTIGIGGIGIDVTYQSVDINNPINYEEPVIPGDRPGESPVTPPNPPGPDDPVVDVIKYTSATIDFDNANDVVDGRDYAVHINSVNGIKNLIVTIDSPYLTEEFLEGVGLTTNFDLAYPGKYDEALKGFEFPTGDEVIGKNDVDFVLTPFIPLLALGGPGLTHKFVLQTIDSKGIAYVKTLTFTCK